MNDLTGAMMAGRDRLLRRGLKLSHLRLLAGLAETGQISATAAQLAMSQPAASRLLSEINAITGLKLYQRRMRGVVLTEIGQRMADWARKVLRDLDAADREITEMVGGRRGAVSIGAVTGPALEIVLPVLRQARVTHPGIVATVVVDTSDRLAEMLSTDQLDFFIGRVPQEFDCSLFGMEPIGVEPVSLIAREGHPLTRLEQPNLAQCVAYDWVLQAPGGLQRHTVETYLLEHDLPLPARVVSTSSILMTLALIAQSNAIAPVARSVAAFFGGKDGLNGRIETLPVAGDLAVSPYSLVRTVNRALSPASEIIHEMVRQRMLAIPGR